MASDLPKITKKQCMQILRESQPDGWFSDGILANCRTSEDIWLVLRDLLPNASMEVITRVLEGGKKKSTKKKSTKKKKASH
jgi:hypothetical protein